MESFRIVLTLSLWLAFMSASLSQDGTVDQAFNAPDIGFGFGDGPNFSVEAIVSQDDGRTIIAGTFTAYNGVPRSGIARLQPDGTLDASYAPEPDGPVRCMALQADGSLIVGGDFTTINGQNCNRVARLTPNGDVDASFSVGAGPDGEVRALAIQADQRILIGGSFLEVDGQPQWFLARLTQAGSLDPTFSASPQLQMGVEAIAIQPDDQEILVPGMHLVQVGATLTPYFRVIRLGTDGNANPNFALGVGGDGPIRAISLQSDGRIVVGGGFTSYNGGNGYRIARLHADGALDQTFSVSTGADDEVRAILVQPDGKLIVGGHFSAFGGQDAGRVARLNSNGTVDDSFAVGTGADDEVFCLERRSDGRLFVGGRFGTFDGCFDGRIVRLLPEGQLDVGFNPGTGVNGGVVSVNAEADGRVLIAGDFCMVNGQVRKRMARLHVDGSLDDTFDSGSGPDGFIFPMERLDDDRWFVGGTFGHFDDYERHHVALLEQDGTLDQSFNPMEGATGPDAGVLALCMQPGQGLIAGGLFTGFGGFQRGGIVRLFMDGSVDASFADQAGFSGYVVAIERLASGHLLVGGAFISYDGIPRNSLAKLDPNGDLDLSFNPELDPGDMVICLAEQSDGAILVGGQVGIAPGGTPGGIIRLLPDGSIDPVFAAGAGLGTNGRVMSMNLLPDGRIIIAGEFTEYDNEPRIGIARLNSDGTLDEGFDPGSGSADITSSVAVGEGVVIGGSFTSFDGVGRNRIARLRNSVVGVSEHEGNSNPLLFPNPSAGRFILRSAEQGEELDVRVHDMLGQEVAMFRHLGGELAMDLSHLPAATYVLRWVSNSRSGTIPVVVTH